MRLAGWGVRFVFAILAGLPAVLMVPVRADRVADVRYIHIEAMGGRARVEALSAMRAVGHVVTGGKRVRFHLLAARPNRVRIETEAGGRTLIQVSDGVAPPWEYDTGTWPPKYRELSPGVAKTLAANAEFDDPLIAGEARGFVLDFAGEVQVEGRKLLRLLVTRRLTETFRLYVDARTYLIAIRTETRASATGRPLDIVTRYRDFRPVRGVLLPYEILVTIDGRFSQQTKIDRIEPNPPITPETFSRPPSNRAEVIPE